MSTIGAVIVCLVGLQLNATVFASEDSSSKPDASAPVVVAGDLLSAPRLRLEPGVVAASAASAQIYRGRPYRSSRRSAAIAALTIGTIAAIAGTAVLVYANRPECSSTPSAGGCGYGAKVIGTSVLVGGAAGLTIGAITW